MWDSFIKNYGAYLFLERSLSKNTIVSYVSDIEKFALYTRRYFPRIRSLSEVESSHIEFFMRDLAKAFHFADSSQSRILSAVKSFFDYCVIENILTNNPAALIEAPKVSRKLPDALSVEEIKSMIDAIDHSSPSGIRSRAMVEVLYASGLRVSELTNLLLSQILKEEELLRVIGKGNKERMAPISPAALDHLSYYITHARNNVRPSPGKEDYVFLNLRGNPISRISVFTIIKDLAQRAQIKKNISPHSLRHAFATHLVEAGADLRSVQQMLGHEHITTTEIYTHLDSSYLRQTLMDCHPMFYKK